MFAEVDQRGDQPLLDRVDVLVLVDGFATLKKDLVNRQAWPTKAGLRSAVFDYVERFYNRERLHSTLGYLSPAQFEERALEPA